MDQGKSCWSGRKSRLREAQAGEWERKKAVHNCETFSGHKPEKAEERGENSQSMIELQDIHKMIRMLAAGDAG